MNYQSQQREEHQTDVLDQVEEGYNLIVWNDHVNTFDWVIKALIDICHHDQVQAEQCTYFIHFKGKYAVKTGNFETLKPMCEGITDRGINASIEQLAN